jgi:hypothetical protein
MYCPTATISIPSKSGSCYSAKHYSTNLTRMSLTDIMLDQLAIARRIVNL